MIEAVLSDKALAGWDGFGIVVQAFGPRTGDAIDWIYALAEKLDRRFMVRLVKGAYWDTEIKLAQVEGMEGFPVFTRKSLDRCQLHRQRPQAAGHDGSHLSAIRHA